LIFFFSNQDTKKIYEEYEQTNERKRREGEEKCALDAFATAKLTYQTEMMSFTNKGGTKEANLKNEHHRLKQRIMNEFESIVKGFADARRHCSRLENVSSQYFQASAT
jgi:hypothetical protein